MSEAQARGRGSDKISRFLLFFLLKGWWPRVRQRDIRWRGITDRLKEMLKCQHQADYARLAVRCPLVRWRWKSLPLASISKSQARRRRHSRGASWASDGLGRGRRDSMSVFEDECVCACVWELLSLFKSHCTRKHRIYWNMIKSKGIVQSIMNILLLLIFILFQTSYFSMEHRWRKFKKNEIIMTVACEIFPNCNTFQITFTLT